jgi:hypothetical protein
MLVLIIGKYVDNILCIVAKNLAECTILPEDVNGFPLALRFNEQK